MTSATPLPCLRCGFEDWDVRMTLVETPEEDRRQVNVAIAHETRKGQLAELEYREVPEVYAREPRCRDRKACDERVAASALAVMPEPEPAQDWVI